jgi:hypothetical protein
MTERTSLSKEDARIFLIMGSIFFALGLIVLLVTRLAGVGMTAMGAFLLAVGAFHYLKRR